MPEYLQSRLLDPLGMVSAIPKFDDAGTFIGSSFVYATARDFARFGTLYLRDGVWDGERLLPEGWVDHARTVDGRRRHERLRLRSALVAVARSAWSLRGTRVRGSVRPRASRQGTW